MTTALSSMVMHCVTAQHNYMHALRPGNTGQTEGLRMDREQIPTFARVLRDLEGLCVVVRNMQSAHESRTDRVRTALISLETR